MDKLVHISTNLKSNRLEEEGSAQVCVCVCVCVGGVSFVNHSTGNSKVYDKDKLHSFTEFQNQWILHSNQTMLQS